MIELTASQITGHGHCPTDSAVLVQSDERGEAGGDVETSVVLQYAVAALPVLQVLAITTLALISHLSAAAAGALIYATSPGVQLAPVSCRCSAAASCRRSQALSITGHLMT